MIFSFRVFIKIIIIAFRRNKTLKERTLYFSTKHLFNRSLLVIRYEFKNALWYEFFGLKKTYKPGTLVLDLENLDREEITLIVQGFLRRKEFVIKTAPQHELNSDLFKACIKKPRHTVLISRKAKIIDNPVIVRKQHLKLLLNNISIENSAYKLKDFV